MSGGVHRQGRTQGVICERKWEVEKAHVLNPLEKSGHDVRQRSR